MDNRQLRYLIAIAHAGSFSRAAIELHMTQPPLSNSVANLESELGARLLTRTSRGASLTPAGAEVVKHAEHVLALESELRRRIRAIESGRIGILALAATPVLTADLVPPIISDLSSEAGGLDVAFHEADPQTIVESILERRIDAGIVATASSPHLRTLYGDELLVEHLRSIPVIAVLPPEFDRLPDPVRLADLPQLDVALPGRSMMKGLRTNLLDAYDRARLAPPHTRDVNSMQEAVPLITSGLAIAMMPDSVRRLIHPDRVALRSLTDGPEPLDVSIIVRHKRADDPILRRFREAAHRHARSAVG